MLKSKVNENVVAVETLEQTTSKTKKTRYVESGFRRIKPDKKISKMNFYPKSMNNTVVNDNYRVGRIIRAQRMIKGMSQADLANKIFCSVPTISRWESGEFAIDPTIIGLICENLDLTPSALFSYGVYDLEKAEHFADKYNREGKVVFSKTNSLRVFMKFLLVMICLAICIVIFEKYKFKFGAIQISRALQFIASSLFLILDLTLIFRSKIYNRKKSKIHYNSNILGDVIAFLNIFLLLIINLFMSVL